MQTRVPYYLPSPEEAKEIKAGNKGLIDRFYLQNRPYILACARAFYGRRRSLGYFVRYEAIDYVQEAYLHMREFDYDNIRYFAHSLFKMFSKYCYGGSRKYSQLSYLYAVDEEQYILDVMIPNGETETMTFGDTVVAPDMVMLSPGFEVSENLYKYLSSFLATEQKKVFACFYWTGLTYNEIATLLDKNPRTVKRTREEIFKKFRKRQDEIKRFLDEIDYADRNGIPA